MDLNFANMEKSVYGGDLDNDEELLAELAALQEEEMGNRRREATTRAGAAPPAAARRAPPGSAVPAIPGVDPRTLAAALADGHEEADDDALEMDDDLLNELAGLVGNEAVRAPAPSQAPVSHPPPVPTRNVAPAPALAPVGGRDEAQISHLRQLHAVYAKMMNASEKAGEGAKARRYKRAVEKLVELVRAAEKGKKIDPAEIPVAPPNFEPVPHPTAPSAQPSHHPTAPSIRQAAAAAPPPVPERQSSTQSTPPPLPNRQSSAVSQGASEPSDPKKASVHRILKHRRDLYIANGKAAIAAHDKVAAQEFVTIAKGFDQAMAALTECSADEMNLDEVPPSPPPYRKTSDAPPAAPAPKTTPVPAQSVQKSTGPLTFIEALQQRQQRYLQMAEKAKTEGNDRKHRMNARLAGQYGDAVREAKAGTPVNIGELPTLPDMPPLPPQTAPGPTQKKPVPKGPPPGMKPPPEVGPLAPSGVEGKSRNSTQLEFLLQRQNEFKQAAIHAKNHGNVEKAKQYLLESKGFDKMIQAARAGLPVNIKDTPIPPQSHTPNATLQPKIQPSTSGGSGSTKLEGRGERLALLEKTLIEQVRLAESNQMRFTRLGDVGKVRLFETWAKSSKQDLLLVRAVAQQGLNLPKFHYELRQIPSADLFPDLAEDILELTIISCRDVPLPSGYEPHHANIYVKYTFPLPTEDPQTGKTKVLGGTISPEFNEQIMLQIGSGKSRNSKLQRTFKRGGLKLEIYQKGGFMRSDKLLGTCEWKLEKLETNAELEDSLPLKDGRKAVGGLTSARVRIREPIGDAKSQSLPQKWLILDN